jgi:hypothetical protein
MNALQRLNKIAEQANTQLTRDTARKELQKIGITLKRAPGSSSDWRVSFNPVFWKQHGIKLSHEDIEDQSSEETDLEAAVGTGKAMARELMSMKGRNLASVVSSIDPFEAIGATEDNTRQARRTVAINDSEYVEIAASANQTFSAILSRKGWKTYSNKTAKSGVFARTFASKAKG